MISFNQIMSESKETTKIGNLKNNKFLGGRIDVITNTSPIYKREGKYSREMPRNEVFLYHIKNYIKKFY